MTNVLCIIYCYTYKLVGANSTNNNFFGVGAVTIILIENKIVTNSNIYFSFVQDSY